MADVLQVQWVSSGWSGGPGYTSFYFEGSGDPILQDAVEATREFLDDIKLNLPTAVTFTAPASARVLDSITGDLVDIVPVTTPVTNVVGGAGTGFASPSGMSVNWLTTTPAESRLTVGRTYIVPLDINSYQADGTLTTTALGVFQTAASLLVTTMNPFFVVWRRPVASLGGVLAPVVAAKVNDRVSVLRSRRS